MINEAPAPALPVTEALLSDADLDDRRRRDGYVSVPLLAPADLEALRRAHAELHPEPGRGFEMDFSFMAPDHKARVDAAIRAVLAPAVARALEPVRLYNLSFVTKWPEGGGELPVHQDWSYVDEDEHECATIWVPLDEATAELDNGPLALLPRSHLLPSPPRGANSRPWYLPYRDALADHLVTPAVEPGHALVFSCRMLHGSPPNRSDAPRRAVTAMVAVEQAPLRYFHVDGSRWQEFDVAEDFFVENGPIDLRLGAPRGAELVATRPAEPPVAPLAELAERCGVELTPADADESPSWAIAGSPLGGSRPTTGGRGARLVHRLLDRGAVTGPDPVARTLDASVAELVAGWEEVGAEGVEAWERRPTADGQPIWAVPPVGRAADPLAAAVRRLVGDRPAWLLLLEPQGIYTSRRTGHNGVRVAVLPLALRQSPGTVLLQAGERLDALEQGRTVSFDPTVEHGIWNFGAGAVPLLVVAGHRPTPLGARGLGWVERALRLPAYDPAGA